MTPTLLIRQIFETSIVSRTVVTLRQLALVLLIAALLLPTFSVARDVHRARRTRHMSGAVVPANSEVISGSHLPPSDLAGTGLEYNGLDSAPSDNLLLASNRLSRFNSRGRTLRPAPLVSISCELYPIALSSNSVSGVAVGGVINDIYNGAKPGNFGWLSWTGDSSEPALTASLNPPGNSSSYVNPDNSSDHEVSVGEWVRGKPGVSNSKDVRDALEALKTSDIIVPVWNEARGQGSNTLYRVEAFAQVRLLSYQLPGQNRISARFLGYAECPIPVNKAPQVNAGPDQTSTLPASISLIGTVTDDGLPREGALTVSWTKVSGPGSVTFVNPTAAVTTASFNAPGSYVLRLTASDSVLSNSDELTVTVKPKPFSSRVYTLNADFDEGSVINVVHSVPDQLQLDDTTRAFNFIWVAVSTKGTIVKIDTETGAVLGEYRTAPEGQPTDTSRTTVDHNGSVWTANRAGNSVVRVGLLENGQCIDRNGNGVIDTSHALGDVRPWPNTGGVDTDGGVETAADECVINYVRVSSQGTRHISVDTNNDVWVSGRGFDFISGNFDLIDGKSGLIKRSELSVGYGGYGGLIDRFGVIWSARRMLRWDTSKPLTGPNGGNWLGYEHDSYGLCIDSKGNVWNTQLENGAVRKFAPNGTLLGIFSHGNFFAQGCVVGRNDDVWVAHSLNLNSVGHLKNDGTFVGNVNVGSGPTGVAVDASGKIWATNFNSRNVSRIDPNAGPIGADGITRVGEVDFTTVDLSGNLYNYSDMTGSTLTGAPNSGTWSTIFDSGIAGAEWGRIGWTAKVCGDGALTVTVASSEDGSTFGPSEIVTSGADPSVANGRYLKITVSFQRAASGESPVLYDLSVGTQGFTLPAPTNSAPEVNAGPDQTITQPNAATLHGAACDDALPAGSHLGISWQKVNGPGTVTFGNSSSLNATAAFSAVGTYIIRLTASDTQFSTSDQVTITVLPQNQPPVVNAGPDQTITLPHNATLSGTATDDGLPIGSNLTTLWSQVSGAGSATFANPASVATTVAFSVPGTYVLRLTASDSALSSSDELTVTVNSNPARSRTYTLNVDFDEGSAINVVHSVPDQLQLDEITRAFNFVWVAVSTKGTIVKIDTETGTVLGEYRTAPENLGRDPSRTTVDHNGNVWTANRADSSVVRVGLLENGQCVDRNSNGVIDTSHALGDIRPWPNADSRDNDGGVETAADECIINYVRVSSSGTRHVSVNADNDVWVSGTVGQIFDLIDGKTGLIKRTEGPVGFGGYGGLIDRSGVIWSANSLLRWDTSKPLTGPNGGNWRGYSHSSYGLCIDSKGNVWNTEYASAIRKFASDGTLLGTFQHGGNPAQGCVVDKNDDVWVAHSWISTTVGHLKNDGTFIGNVAVGSGPTGVAVDAFGKIWATSYNSRTVSRINPQAGPIGADGVTRVGEVDFTTVDLGGNLYNYSDMTGSTLTGAPNSGTWSTVFDSGVAAAEWGRIGWTAKVCGDGALTVSVASSGDGSTFGPVEIVTSGADPSVADGRYLKISVNFRRAASGESPVLYDLSVGTQGFTLPSSTNAAPEVDAGPDQTITQPNIATLHGVVCDDALPAGSHLGISWQKVSGPGSVTFGNASTVNTTATFSATGNYVLRLVASDTQFSTSDQVTITVLPVNLPPVVNAGPDQTITLPNNATLSGTASDDGQPPGSTLTIQWTKVSGPGTVTFSSPNQPTSSATFSAAGTYALRLTASDSQLASSADVTVTVLPQNQPPIVNAGPDQALSFLGTASSKGNIVVNHDEWTISNLGFASSPDAGRLALNLASFFTGGKPGKFLAYSSSFAVTDEQFLATLTGEGHTLTVSTSVDFSLPNLLQYDGIFLAADPVDNAVLINYVKAGGNVYLALGTGTGGPFAEAARWNIFLNAFDLNTKPEYNLISGVFPITSQHPIFSGVRNLFYGNGQSVNRLSLFDLHTTVVESGFFGIYQTSAQVQLNGVVTDDGLPPGSALAISWTKVSGPGAVAFGNVNAAVTTATFSEPGSYVLRLTADDSQLSSSDDVIITVDSSEVVNQPPIVDAGPEQPVALPNNTSLSGAASDDGLPQGSSLIFQWSKVSGPGSVTFSSPNQTTTSATFSAAGTYVLQLQASDTQFTSSDTVVVNVITDNQPPTVNAGSDQTIAFGNAANLTGSASDDGRPTGATLTALWTKVSGPGTVTFGSASQPATTATFSAGGQYVLRLAANDSELTNSDDLTIIVNQAPAVNAGPDQTITLPSTATLNYTVSDDGLPAGNTTVTWSKVSGSGSVNFQTTGESTVTATFSEAGVYVLRLSADDSHLITTDEVTVTVNAAGPPPLVSIISPTDESNVTTRVDVVGSVSDGVWKLEHSLTADEGTPTQWTTIATGIGPVSNSLVGVFDPTMLLNGRYLIRLSATRGGQTSSDSVSVVVSEEQKVGNFSITFSDLSVPVAGLPIEVTRTYDSRDKRQGDFGFGWTLGIRNVRLQESRAMGAQWQGDVSGGQFPTYCINPSKPHVVTVTLASGRVYKFEAVLNAGNGCQALAPLQEVTLSFKPLPGTNASLIPLGENPLLVHGPFPGAIQLLDSNTVAPVDYDLYQLILEDGTVLFINQHTGVQQMTDTNGNTLTITPGGIIHSSGKSVIFSRDSQGRITQITDPAGNAMSYTYDASGDLISFSDREGNVTTFTYNSTHGLLTINDPRGIQPLRNEYDADGRLIRQVDAFNKEINFTHDLDGQQETVFDRLGHVTVYDYDARGNVVRVQDAKGNVTTRTYDPRDNLLSETNALGKIVSYTYDDQDNRLSEKDALGNTTQYTYNSRKQVLTATDPAGGITTYTYDANGNQTAVKDALDNTTSSTFSANGLQLTSADALNNTTSFEYDASGNLIKQTDPLGNVTTFTYDANGNRLSESERRNLSGATETLTTTFEYDKLGRQTKVIYPDSSTTETIYNNIGKQSVTIDQLGRRTRYDYDEMGQLIRTTYPDATKEETQYDAEGRRVKSLDRAGRATSYTYDSLGRLEKVTYPDNAAITTIYDGIGQVLETKDALGNITSYEYDDAGRRTKVIDALSNETVFGYDMRGNQTSVKDAKGEITQHKYDADNRRIMVRFPDDTMEWTVYDSLGQVLSKTDQAGALTQFEYDARGKLIKVTDALGGVTRYTYDEQGNQITQTDANNHTTSYSYDLMGRRLKRTLPLGMSETYAYDLAGNLTSRTDFRDKTTTFAYDVMNRLLSKTPDASLGEAAVTFSYTTTGRRLTMNDASGATSYAYDPRDRLVRKETPQGTLSYTYDAAGNMKSLRSSNANSVTLDYDYDARNRIANVVDNRLAGATTFYTYDANGNLEAIVYPNAVRTAYTYNTLNRLTNLNTTKGATLANYAYTLGPAGNRRSVTEAGVRKVDYDYDALYRLKTETIVNDPVVANNGSINYAYDAVGNRLNRASTVGSIPTTSSTYDSNDRLTSDSYDPNGNTTASNGNAYQYDFENRLTSLNGGAVRFVYDGDGNRVAKTMGGVTIKYLVDTNNPTGHAQVVEELIGSSVQRTYTYGHDLISQSQFIGGVWTPSFYGYDGHGSVRYLTNALGAITDTYTYDAFGNLIARTGTTSNDYLYAGEQLDANLEFYYLRARWMNASSGRFQTIDTFDGRVFNPQTLHKYSYANGDPANKRDPTGRFAVLDTAIAPPSWSAWYPHNIASGAQLASRLVFLATAVGVGIVAASITDIERYRDRPIRLHHYTTFEGLARIELSGLIRNEDPAGSIYFSPDVYWDSAVARAALAICKYPDVRITLDVYIFQDGCNYPARRVSRREGERECDDTQPVGVEVGGGKEIWTSKAIPLAGRRHRVAPLF